jgi:hypothetical protein
MHYLNFLRRKKLFAVPFASKIVNFYQLLMSVSYDMQFLCYRYVLNHSVKMIYYFKYRMTFYKIYSLGILFSEKIAVDNE